jgi:uncharacterized protein YyaL (SSP411 family)
MSEHLSGEPEAPTERRANRLAGETSPYLLQHAHNPVDWYPWGSEALERARREDKPVLLSVGYAACHWCHVMERESFENEDTAEVMNQHFVSIKVDREERPDIDVIYMDAVQALAGQGGWPMTVFLTPEGEPFYGGTYFPDEDRHGMPAFRRVLEAVAEAWRERRDEVTTQGRQLSQAIGRQTQLRESRDPLSEDVLRSAFAALARVFDREWGGFGGAPKFPQPMTLEFLLRCHLRGYPDALDLLRVTLDRMAAGGMYDQVGGGFHRYSVDGRWHVPHFEKMLYDNAQLVRVYARAWQVTRRDRYREVAAETIEYLLREMRHPDGGFYSSQDADSEGVEGKFFVWSWDELVEVAGESAATYLGATREGNWEGTNVLWKPSPAATVAAEFGIDEQELLDREQSARAELFRRREGRVRPTTDDKILASWNGLAVAALAEAGRALGEPRYVDAASEAAEFVLSQLRRDDGRLLRTWRDGTAGRPGYADDYASMCEAALALARTTLDLRWVQEAHSLAEELVRLFHDPERGGFFQTGADAEELVIRPKELFDNAVPSGNSAAADALQRVALLYGEARLERAGLSALRLVRDPMVRAPTGFGHALCALDLYLGPSREIALVGDGESTRPLAEVLWNRFLPNTVLAAGGPDSDIPLLNDRPLVDGRAAAYVCERFVCQRPVTLPEELAVQLEA